MMPGSSDRLSRFAVRLTALVLVIASAAAGCQPGRAPQPTAQLAGQVTLDGQPIATGQITFMPQGQGQARPTSAAITDGQYEVAEAPVGQVKVMFSATRETGKVTAIPNSDEKFAEVVSIIPPQYARGIDLEVAGDNLQQNFELKSH